MKTIIFDFGSVIGFFDYGRTIEKLIRFTDLAPDELYNAFYDGNLENEYESGHLNSQQFLKRIREIGRLSCDLDVIDEAWSNIFWANDDVCALIPNLAERYRLLLGSNTNELHANWFIRQFADTLRHFDKLILSHEVRSRKPRPEFFQCCLNFAECDPHECVFIDDLPVNVDGAIACRMNGIVYRSSNELRRRLTELGVSL